MCEILAPSGAFEQLQAAINAGADAVYLGYGEFNARRNAKNFTFEELTQAVEYCHSYGVKVHATVNTLIKDNETENIYSVLTDLAKANVDAVIVQDLGVARIIKQSFPDLIMHASTQLTVHNVSGAKLLKSLGFSRVVLSRELSEKEIEKICKETDIEIEVFIHGALCMSISGGCYLSSVLGQRSGNRGLCAQPCRLDFTLNNRDHALSLKDMCHIPYLKRLKEIGVTSFKIEGRMKRPEYVYASVLACKQALNGEKPDLETLKNVFSRSGFTDGYITGKRDINMFGYRKKEDVINSEKVIKSLSVYKNPVQRVPLTLKAYIKDGEEAIIIYNDGINSATVTGKKPEKALTRETSGDDVLKQLSKTGGTPYYIKENEVFVSRGISYPLSELNALRRQALDKLTKERIKRCEQTILPLKKEKIKLNMEQTTVIRVANIEQLKFVQNDTPVIIPIEHITQEILSKYKTVIGEIPSLIFPFDEDAVFEKLAILKEFGLKTISADNISGIYFAKELKFNIICSWGMNVLNSLSVFALNDMGVKGIIASFESSKRGVEELSNPVPVGHITYGYLPLMRMRACPNKHQENCKNCKGVSTIKDRMNVEFTLICNNKKFTTLLNSVPLCVFDENIKSDFNLLYFTVESPERVKEILELSQNNSALNFTRTKGLYFKNLK